MLRRRARDAARLHATRLREQEQRKKKEAEHDKLRRAVSNGHAANAALGRDSTEGQVVDDPTHANLKALRGVILAEQNATKAKAKAKASAKACAEAAGVRASIFV